MTRLTLVSSESLDLMKAGRHLARRHETLNRVRIGLQRLVRKSEVASQSGQIARNLLDEVHFVIRRNDEWRDFEERLIDSQKEFLHALNRMYPDLSGTERAVCLLSRLDLSTQEIADILFVTPRSIEAHRYRIRKKLGVPTHQSLPVYFERALEDNVAAA